MHVWQYSLNPSNYFRDAAYRSVATLTFVAPKTFLPILTDRIAQSFDSALLSFIGGTEIGIFRTPAGNAYVDGKPLLNVQDHDLTYLYQYSPPTVHIMPQSLKARLRPLISGTRTHAEL